LRGVGGLEVVFPSLAEEEEEEKDDHEAEEEGDGDQNPDGDVVMPGGIMVGGRTCW
jgi:hypothetical protein